MGATTSLLRRNRDFRRLYLALVISLVGDWFAFVAVSTMLVELTGRQSMPAAVYAGDQPAPTAEPVTDSPNPSTYRFFLSTPNGGNIGNISAGQLLNNE